MLELRLHPLASAVLAAGVLLFAAGCGGDEAADPTADSAVVPLESPKPSKAATSENPLNAAAERAQRAKKAEKGDPKRLGEREGDPELPASKGDDLEPASSSDRLKLSSTGSAGTWRIAASLDNESFCVTAATPGPADPRPMCSDPTAAALTLSTSDGGVQLSVDPIRETARGKETKLLVWGVAQRAVPKIIVKYGDQTKTAKVGRGALALTVDAQTAKALGGEADVKSPIYLRTFGVSFDLPSGNPPKNAVASPATPNGKPVTLTLQ